MHRFSLAAAPRRPWKNGGGETRELAVAPPGAGLDDFDWRLSCAQVANGGPFSAFPGVDRSLAVLDGAGLRLECADGATHLLSAESAPLAFPGELAVTATLPGGPVGDFNLMTRRARWTHHLQRLRLCGEWPLAADADLTLVYCAAGVGLDCWLAGGRELRLAAGEGVLLDALVDGAATLMAPQVCKVLLGRLWRC
ncbi:hypothetical protein SAMN05216229_1308 [Geopseudomonas sagittaria]|uniref:HutD protein n=1 Tax=Geopseudomonas sagittaria TaxID=1135990 RepID=A0A1I5Z825_9GAMM|nr:HutD family protein [Pseudomonas sagittaria]SFQ52602.1 hypothetical protein SAMN05216229_1308 [Pseudomonas sagittaria]